MLYFTPALAKNSQIKIIQDQIITLTGKDLPEYKSYAKSIIKYSKQYKVNPSIVVSIIMTESSFSKSALSSTGDIGLVQINPKIWIPEFKRLFNEDLDVKKLATDSDYAIHKMIQILSYHQCDKDPYWFAKYHSKTPSLKKIYAKRVLSHSKRLASN